MWQNPRCKRGPVSRVFRSIQSVYYHLSPRFALLATWKTIFCHIPADERGKFFWDRHNVKYNPRLHNAHLQSITGIFPCRKRVTASPAVSIFAALKKLVLQPLIKSIQAAIEYKRFILTDRLQQWQTVVAVLLQSWRAGVSVLNWMRKLWLN